MADLAGERFGEHEFFGSDDMGYHQWLIQVNGICLRFLDVELENFPLHIDDSFDWYAGGFSEERYFLDMILPDLRREAGIDYIDRIVAQMCKYGFELGRRL